MLSRLFRHRSCERTVGWPSREIKLPREERELSGIYSSSYIEVSRRSEVLYDLNRAAIRSFLYSFLREASWRWGGMGLCLEFSKFYPMRRRNDVLKRREIEREKDKKRQKETRQEAERKVALRRSDMTRGRILCLGVCRVWNSYVRSVEIDFGDTAILPFSLSFSLSLLLEKLRCCTRCVRDADRRRGSPFTIVTAVGAVNSKIGNQGLSFNLYVCVRERECRGNRHGNIGVLRFSPKTNFYVKRK